MWHTMHGMAMRPREPKVFSGRYAMTVMATGRVFLTEIMTLATFGPESRNTPQGGVVQQEDDATAKMTAI